MNLKANPFGFYAQSDSPVALHVRMNWSGASSRDEREAKAQITRIEARQSSDGSWDGSVVSTISKLFDLWLLGARDEKTQRGVDWLLEADRPPFRCTNNDGGSYDDMFFHMTSLTDRNGLREVPPFTPGCAGFVKTGAALFLAYRFRQGDAGRIRRASATINHLFTYRKGRPCSGSCNMNLLLGMSASPKFFNPDSQRASLAWTASQQRPGGDWNRGIPFYQYTYTLSQSPAGRAHSQYDKALTRALKVQRSDGSWAGDELKTFLLLPVMKAASLL